MEELNILSHRENPAKQKLKNIRNLQVNHFNIENLCPNFCPDENQIRLLGEWILGSQEKFQRSWNINIIFVTPKMIKDLNRQFFSKTEDTDVISFNIDDGDPAVGEIYICRQVVARHAKNLKIPFEDELVRIVAHGLYHLLGFEDNTPSQKKRMTDLEDNALAAVLGQVERNAQVKE